MQCFKHTWCHGLSLYKSEAVDAVDITLGRTGRSGCAWEICSRGDF